MSETQDQGTGVSQQQGTEEGAAAGLNHPTGGAYNFRYLLSSLVAGIVCGLLAVVFSISDAALLFSGALSHYVTIGIGLCLFSTIILAGVTAFGSSYPGMISLSQEVTVVTLAVIAASMHTAMSGVRSEQEILLTIVVAIGLATSFTGLCLLALGIFRLGRFIRFIPYSVIGGFLAGMGWLIVHAALGVIIGETPTPDSLHVLVDPANLAKWVPAILFACTLWAIAHRGGNIFALPVAICAAMVLFHLAAWFQDVPLHQLQAEGRLFELPDQSRIWPPFSSNPFDSVDWGVIWAEVPKIMTMVLVTAASVLLASSGIELAVRHDVDLDREFQTAGVANLLAGLGGGAAGFQGLGLSLLAHKLGAPYRLVGFIVAAVCTVTLIYGSSLLAYMPIPLFGGLLLWIGISLLYDWLVDAFFKMPRREYLIILLIVLVISTVGFLEGVTVGLISAIVLFALDYSRVQVVKYAVTADEFHSSVERPNEDRQFLNSRGKEILILRLQGFVFFGTAHTLQRFVRTRLREGVEPKLRFLLLDTRSVTGLDSSAVLSFVKIGQIAERSGVTLITTNLPPAIQGSLAEGGFGPESGLPIQSFDDLDRALEWCEERLLDDSTHKRPPARDDSIKGQLSRALGGRKASQTMMSYLEKIELEPNATLIRQGEESRDLFFVEHGKVGVQIEAPDGTRIRVSTMGVGTIVGELAFYLDQHLSASVVTESETIVWRLSRDSLAKMTAEAPDIASSFHEHLIRILAERLIQTTRLVRSLSD